MTKVIRSGPPAFSPPHEPIRTKCDAYSGRTVSLQFRAKGTDSYKTLEKVTTSSTGGLKTTVTATVDGSYRWVYRGNSTTGVATSAADDVDVR